MLLIAGLVFLALGLLSGAFLVLVPAGLIDRVADLTLWALFPGLTIMGYLMAALSLKPGSLPLLSRATGTVLLLLALIAAVTLVLQGGSLIAARADTFSLWYVLALGVSLGAAGVSSHRKVVEP
jgi:hypothetical protein